MAKAKSQDAGSLPSGSDAGEDPGLANLLKLRDAEYAKAAEGQRQRDTAAGVVHPATTEAEARDPGLDALLAKRDAAYASHQQAQATQEAAEARRAGVYTTYQVPAMDAENTARAANAAAEFYKTAPAKKGGRGRKITNEVEVESGGSVTTSDEADAVVAKTRGRSTRARKGGR